MHARAGPRRAVATAQEERVLAEKRRFDAPFDVHGVPGTGIADLDRMCFEGEYPPSAVDRNVLAENGRGLEERLAAAKMISFGNDPSETLLGLLVVGVRPHDFVFRQPHPVPSRRRHGSG